MRMLSILLLATTIVVSTAFIGDEKYNVETENSSLKWTARKVTGEHFGFVDFKEGMIRVNDGKIIGGKIVVDMTSISVEDLDGNWANKLENHLKSDDFFSVANHETASFLFGNVKLMENGQYDVLGILEIKGIKKPISFPANVVISEQELTFSATLHVDRTEYGIKYGSSKFFSDIGDRAIEDEFDIDIVLKAKR